MFRVLQNALGYIPEQKWLWNILKLLSVLITEFKTLYTLWEKIGQNILIAEETNPGI